MCLFTLYFFSSPMILFYFLQLLAFGVGTTPHWGPSHQHPLLSHHSSGCPPTSMDFSAAILFYSCLHLSCPLTVTSPPSLLSLLSIFTVTPVSFSFTFMYSVLSLLTFIPLQALLPLLPTLTIDHVCEHHSPRRLLPNFICQPVHYHSIQEGPQSQSHPLLEPVCHSYCTSQCCLAVLINAPALTCFSATPDFLMQYHSSSFGIMKLLTL